MYVLVTPLGKYVESKELRGLDTTEQSDFGHTSYNTHENMELLRSAKSVSFCGQGTRAPPCQAQSRGRRGCQRREGEGRTAVAALIGNSFY